MKKYDICVDNAGAILKVIKKLIEDMDKKNAAGIVEDVFELVFTMISVGSDCAKI